MKPILISWLTEGEDIREGAPSLTGPNGIFHQHFWQHSEHLLLYPHPELAEAAHQLARELKRRYPARSIRVKLLAISQRHNLAEVKSRLETLLLSHRSLSLDLLLQTGDKIQQLAWYLGHQSLALDTRLLLWHHHQGSPQLQSIVADPDLRAYSVLIRQHGLDHPREETQFMTPRMLPIYRKAYRAGQNDQVRVLISGASGTGKTHLARYLHQQSPRKEAPFVTVICHTTSEEQFLDQLFGQPDQPGSLSLAQGGTLMLCDVDELSLFAQHQLVQLIQRAPGLARASQISSSPDVRIISTSSQDLSGLCAKGAFRWELYYLLAVVELEIPTLYERGVDEIGRLIDHFLHEKRILFKRAKPLRLAEEVRRHLETYPWPGNVRELEQVIERLYVFCDEVATMEELPRRLRQTKTDGSENWRDVEARHLRRVYERYGRNKSRTCRVIGYGSINTLKKKLREYGIEGENETVTMAEETKTAPYD